MAAKASPVAAAALDRAMSNPALRAVGRVSQTEKRYALPTFLWATSSGTPVRRPAATAARGVTRPAADAARGHMSRVAPFYRLNATDVREATVRRVHDTGRGGVIASLSQVIDGVEVFRDGMNVLMDRDQSLVAVSGYLPSRDLLGRGSAVWIT